MDEGSLPGKKRSFLLCMILSQGTLSVELRSGYTAVCSGSEWRCALLFAVLPATGVDSQQWPLVRFRTFPLMPVLSMPVIDAEHQYS